MPEQATAEPATTALSAALDKWDGKRTKTPPAPPIAVEKVPEKVAEPVKVPEPVKEPEKPAQPEFKLPEFVTGEEPKKSEPTPEPEEIPEAPEAIKKDPKQAEVWEKSRKVLDERKRQIAKLEKENQELKNRGQAPDETITKRIAELETKNKQYEQYFQRSSIENHPAFIQQVLKPMQLAYADAKRIITEAGGDPATLDRAISVSGKGHYDAMDEILAGLPESAKGELTATMRDYSRFAKQRENAMANAPQVAEDMRRQDETRQLAALTEHKQSLTKQFDDVLKHTRDVYGFELLRRSDNPEHTEWNTMVDNIEAAGRDLALENQDQVKMLQAAILAPAAITLRDLWKKELTKRVALQKELDALRNSEPSLSSSSAPSPTKPSKDDMKKPFKDLFIDVLKSKPWEK